MTRTCTELRCNRSPNTVSLHVLTALSCCASCRLLFVTYAMIARQERSRCCLSISLGQHGPQNLRILSGHERLFIKAAAYARTCLRRKKRMPHVAALYRYPVKGFTPEECDTLTVRDDGRIAGDRVLGIRFADSAAADEAWSRKTEMVALMNTPGLARLHLKFKAEALRLRLSFGSTVFADEVLTPEGRQRLATAVAAYVLTLDENPLSGHPERLPLRVIGDGLTPRYHDAEAGQVTLHGRGS